MWFIPHTQNKMAKINLFCFHHAGGSASFFFDWAALLTPFVNLISIQLPGREARFGEPFIQDVQLVVEKLISHSNILAEKPSVFFGHSLGSIIVFELARKLQHLSLPMPICFIVSGHGAPKFSDAKEKIYSLPDPQFLKRLIEKYGGIDDEILNCPELLSFMLPRIRADIYLSENYKYLPAPPLKCPIFVMGGTSDASVPINELQKWEEESEAQTRIYTFQGDHFFLRQNKASVLERLNKILANYL